MTERVQIRHPLLDRWVKLDTRTGRILAVKKSRGPWSGVKRYVDRVVDRSPSPAL